MSAVAQLLSTGIIRRLGSRTVNTASGFYSARHWAYTLRPVPFATYSRRRHQSSMASESLNSSESDVRNQGNRRSSSQTREGTPYAARAAAGAAVANSFFPLGYREGFSQWVCYFPKHTAAEPHH